MHEIFTETSERADFDERVDQFLVYAKVLAETGNLNHDTVLQNDREVVIAAVARKGTALAYASDALERTGMWCLLR